MPTPSSNTQVMPEPTSPDQVAEDPSSRAVARDTKEISGLLKTLKTLNAEYDECGAWARMTGTTAGIEKQMDAVRAEIQAATLARSENRDISQADRREYAHNLADSGRMLGDAASTLNTAAPVASAVRDVVMAVTLPLVGNSINDIGNEIAKIGNLSLQDEANYAYEAAKDARTVLVDGGAAVAMFVAGPAGGATFKIVVGDACSALEHAVAYGLGQETLPEAKANLLRDEESNLISGAAMFVGGVLAGKLMGAFSGEAVSLVEASLGKVGGVAAQLGEKIEASLLRTFAGNQVAGMANTAVSNTAEIAQGQLDGREVSSGHLFYNYVTSAVTSLFGFNAGIVNECQVTSKATKALVTGIEAVAAVDAQLQQVSNENGGYINLHDTVNAIAPRVFNQFGLGMKNGEQSARDVEHSGSTAEAPNAHTGVQEEPTAHAPSENGTRISANGKVEYPSDMELLRGMYVEQRTAELVTSGISVKDATLQAQQESTSRGAFYDKETGKIVSVVPTKGATHDEIVEAGVHLAHEADHQRTRGLHLDSDASEFSAYTKAESYANRNGYNLDLTTREIVRVPDGELPSANDPRAVRAFIEAHHASSSDSKLAASMEFRMRREGDQASPDSAKKLENVSPQKGVRSALSDDDDRPARLPVDLPKRNGTPEERMIGEGREHTENGVRSIGDPSAGAQNGATENGGVSSPAAGEKLQKNSTPDAQTTQRGSTAADADVAKLPSLGKVLSTSPIFAPGSEPTAKYRAGAGLTVINEGLVPALNDAGLHIRQDHSSVTTLNPTQCDKLEAAIVKRMYSPSLTETDRAALTVVLKSIISSRGEDMQIVMVSAEEFSKDKFHTALRLENALKSQSDASGTKPYVVPANIEAVLPLAHAAGGLTAAELRNLHPGGEIGRGSNAIVFDCNERPDLVFKRSKSKSAENSYVEIGIGKTIDVMEKVPDDVATPRLLGCIKRDGYDWQVFERAKGKPLGSEFTRGTDTYPAWSDNLKALASAPQEHFNKFVRDAHRLAAAQIMIDPKPDNFFYDPNRGFSFVDIDNLRGADFQFRPGSLMSASVNFSDYYNNPDVQTRASQQDIDNMRIIQSKFQSAGLTAADFAQISRLPDDIKK